MQISFCSESAQPGSGWGDENPVNGNDIIDLVASLVSIYYTERYISGTSMQNNHYPFILICPMPQFELFPVKL